MILRLDKMPWLRDWLTLRSVEYVAVFHDDRAELVRLSGGKRRDVVLQVGAEASEEATATRFFATMSKSSAYYGQPFAVLINNSKAFSYATQLTGVDPAVLRKRLQLLSGEQHEFRWSIERINGEDYVIGQGVAGDYLAHLRKSIEAARMPVRGLGTLAAQWAPSILNGAATDRQALYRHPTVMPYHFQTSESARWRQRSLNVGRLLTAVLAAIALASAIIALAFATGRADYDLDDIRRYQLLYSAKLEMEAHIAQTRRELAHADRSRPVETYSAPLVSVFCQYRVTGVYLTRLAVRHWGGDSTTVEAKGIARRESQSFAYATSLNSFVAASGFAVRSITPEVVASMGQPDTVQSFRLSLVQHGQSTVE